MAIKNVAIIGANGDLGAAILNALGESKDFKVTVLSRASSKSTFPKYETRIIPDDLNVDATAAALQGHDALVVSIKASQLEAVKKLADACVKAGVQRIIPPDYGSVDSKDPRALELLPLYGFKGEARAYLEKLTKGNTTFSWTSLVCGHFFDFGLTSGLLHVHLQTSEALIFDDGKDKFSATTLPKIGQAVVQILQNVEQTRNQILYIESFNVTQYDIIESCKRVRPSEFKISFAKSEEFIKDTKVKSDDGDHQATEDLVGVLGIKRANFADRLSNDLLGLKPEDLDTVVSAAYRSLSK